MPRIRSTPLHRERQRARGRGWGWGLFLHSATTPTPNPSPQGGGEHTESAVRAHGVHSPRTSHGREVKQVDGIRDDRARHRDDLRRDRRGRGRAPGPGPGASCSNVVRSQIKEHAPFGGVVPEIAARAHVEVLDLIIAQAMQEAGVRLRRSRRRRRHRRARPDRRRDRRADHRQGDRAGRTTSR